MGSTDLIRVLIIEDIKNDIYMITGFLVTNDISYVYFKNVEEAEKYIKGSEGKYLAVALVDDWIRKNPDDPNNNELAEKQGFDFLKDVNSLELPIIMVTSKPMKEAEKVEKPGDKIISFEEKYRKANSHYIATVHKDRLKENFGWLIEKIKELIRGKIKVTPKLRPKYTIHKKEIDSNIQITIKLSNNPRDEGVITEKMDSLIIYALYEYKKKYPGYLPPKVVCETYRGSDLENLDLSKTASSYIYSLKRRLRRMGIDPDGIIFKVRCKGWELNSDVTLWGFGNAMSMTRSDYSDKYKYDMSDDLPDPNSID